VTYNLWNTYTWRLCMMSSRCVRAMQSETAAIFLASRWHSRGDLPGIWGCGLVVYLVEFHDAPLFVAKIIRVSWYLPRASSYLLIPLITLFRTVSNYQTSNDLSNFLLYTLRETYLPVIRPPTCRSGFKICEQLYIEGPGMRLGVVSSNWRRTTKRRTSRKIARRGKRSSQS
jgi:hypothetical protein